MALSLYFALDLQADYHVGAGFGEGLVDSLLQRDRDGIPVLRGTILTGLFRDALVRMLDTPALQRLYPPRCRAGAMGSSPNQPAYCGADAATVAPQPICPVCRLLGSPAYPKHWEVQSARLAGAPLTGARAQHIEIQTAQPVWRCRIDPRFRRVQAHKLFSVEEGKRGHSFHFQVSTNDTGAHLLDEAALWVATARFIREFGRSRRRGLGQCRMRLIGVNGLKLPQAPEACQQWQNRLLDEFKKRWLDTSPTAPARRPRVSVDTKAPPQFRIDSGFLLRVIVRLDEPLLLTERSTAGNQFQTRDSIPGTALRGALARRAGALIEKNYAAFISLFLRGSVRFSPLYVALNQEGHLYPGWPVPMDGHTCKVQPWTGSNVGHGFQGLALQSPVVASCTQADCGAPLMPVNGYLHPLARWRLSRPIERSELHIRIDPKTQRVREGDLYGYSLVDAGQYFVGTIRVDSEDVWRKLQAAANLAEKEPIGIRLGKAFRRGYGAASLWLEKTAVHPWRPLELQRRVPDLNAPLRLMLLSDSIVVDPWGRFAEGFSAGWLEAQLNLGKIRIVRAFSTEHPIDGFQNVIGLPRWRDRALAAGSVVGIQLESPPENTMDRMKVLETEGIGARRSEGYGQVLFNPACYDPAFVPAASILLNEKMQAPDLAASNPLAAQARFLTWWRQHLEEKIGGSSGTFQDQRFDALARWLLQNRHLEPTELKIRLDRWGRPPEGLVLALGGRGELGERGKGSFLAEDEDGKKGKRVITELLDELTERNESERTEAVMLLAGIIARYTRKGGRA